MTSPVLLTDLCLLEIEPDGVRLRLAGDFTYQSRKDFDRLIRGALSAGTGGQIRVDLAAVDYLDSAALGMLLLLRERGACLGRTVSLQHARAGVLQVLETANFRRLFQID